MIEKNSSLFPDDNGRPNEYWVPETFFECMNDSKFLDMLRGLLDGEGYWHSSGFCEFPNAQEEDGDFRGVRFSNWEDDVLIVSQEEMEILLFEASQRYALINPSKGEDIKRIYKRHGKTFDLPKSDGILGLRSFLEKTRQLWRKK